MDSQFKTLVSELEPTSLEKGDAGIAVKTLQDVLQALSLYHGESDGCFGSDLENSIRHLQRDFGLTQTGLFDHPTWYALTFWAEHEYAAGAESLAQVPQGLGSGAVASQSLASILRRATQFFVSG